MSKNEYKALAESIRQVFKLSPEGTPVISDGSGVLKDGVISYFQ